MIQDFTNPHGEMKPLRVENIEKLNHNKPLRIERFEGLFQVQELMHGSLSEWFPVIDFRTGMVNKFQTLQEAENLIKRIRTPHEIYYY